MACGVRRGQSDAIFVFGVSSKFSMVLSRKVPSLVRIEHNLDLSRNADDLIDMGPGGGRIVASGTPETVRATKTGVTGRYL